MQNFNCAPPVMQFNVQIPILLALLNYSAHMYEFLSQSTYHNHNREQTVTHSIIRKVLLAKHQHTGQVASFRRWHLTATHHHKVHTTNVGSSKPCWSSPQAYGWLGAFHQGGSPRFVNPRIGRKLPRFSTLYSQTNLTLSVDCIQR
jgi:hypothetical protein